MDQYNNQELKRVTLAIKNLEQYREDESIRSLPKDIQDQLRSVETLDPLTSGGLEKIGNVLDNLYVCKYVLDGTYKAESNKPKNKQDNKPKKSIEKNTQININSNKIQEKKGPNQNNQKTYTKQNQGPIPKSQINSSWTNNNQNNNNSSPISKSIFNS